MHFIQTDDLETLYGLVKFSMAVQAITCLLSAIVGIMWLCKDSTQTRTNMARFFVADAILTVVATFGGGYLSTLISGYFAFECYKFASYFDQKITS